MAHVAVLLPVYNHADTLAACLESLRTQTLSDIEIIAVDDGSTDGSGDLLEQAAREDPRVRVAGYPVNQGISAALDHGLNLVRSPFVARMDADDWSHPDRLARQLGFLRTHPDIGLVGCRVDYGGDRRSQQGYAVYVDWINSLVTPEEIALNRFVESPFAHPSVLFRTELTGRYGAYRKGPFPEDYELWLRWLDAGVRMAKLEDILLRWNDSPGRLSRTDSRYDMEAFYACKAHYLARWLARNNPYHPDVVVWGAGRLSRKRADMLGEHGIRITHYIDIDPRKIGQIIHGRPVWSEQELPPPGQCFVVSYVGSRGAREDIRNRLCRHGYREGRDAIMAA